MPEAKARDVDYPPSATASERVLRGKLRWGISWCEADTPVEEDGVGVAPPQVRVLLLAQHGEWGVHVGDLAARPKVMRALRLAFNLSLPQVGAATAAMPGEVYCGTRGEATLLAERLEADGVPTRLVRS